MSATDDSATDTPAEATAAPSGESLVHPQADAPVADEDKEAIRRQKMEELAQIAADLSRTDDVVKGSYAARNEQLVALRRRGVADVVVAERLGMTQPRLHVIHSQHQKKRMQ